MRLHPLVKGYQYSDCRLLGHMWHVVPSDWTPTFGVPMTVRCERCNIERRDTFGRNTGHLESRHYAYPAGYQYRRENGIELPNRDDFRLAWLEGAIREARQQRADKRKKVAVAP